MEVLKVDLKKIYLSVFYDFARALQDDQYTFYILKGGRNSAKSSHVSMDIVLEVMKNPISALVFKRYANSLEKTVIPQIEWAMEMLKVSHMFKFVSKKNAFIYIPTGNLIYFVGADQPERIKGLKDSKYPIAIGWGDEITQFRTEVELLSIEDSIIRDKLPNGLHYRIIYSYNPPNRKGHWCNKKYNSALLNKDHFVHHSTYETNPYISNQLRVKAEHMKIHNRNRYDWIYAGLALGDGVVPFRNLTIRTITDEEIEGFDNIKQGLDYGYAVDPVAMGRMHYDKTKRKLYIFKELYEVQFGNRALANAIKTDEWWKWDITSDRDKRTKDNLEEEYGINNIYEAKKGAGSKEMAENWLNDLEEIIIDPQRCPNGTWEFENIDYAVNKEGKTLARLEDGDDHFIDQCKYAMEDTIRGFR